MSVESSDGHRPTGPRRARVGRRDARRSDIAAQLLRAVEELLAEGGGYTDLGIAEIIERADVRRSTFYYHFQDKAELLIEIGAKAIEEIVAASYDLYRLTPNSKRKDFTQQVRATVRTWVPHVPLMSAISELSAYDLRVRQHFGAAWAVARKGITDHIREGQQAGFIRPEVDPLYTGAWLTWMAERGMGFVAAEAPPEDDERVIQSLADIVWRTLYLRSAD